MATEDELLQALQHGYSGYINNGHLALEDLPQYAQQLKEDLDWIGLESFQILPPQTLRVRIGQDDGTVPIMHYKFGSTRNNVDNADPQQTKSELQSLKNTEGPGLDRDDLRWLCDVLRGARITLPHLWLMDEDLRADLAAPKKHLDSVNELFWLGRWKNVRPQLTMREHRANPSISGSFDWSLICDSHMHSSRETRINIEVKNLTSSLEGALFYGHDGALRFVQDGMRGLSKKLPHIISDDINIVCFTTFLNHAQKLRELAAAICDEYKSVDAVLFWIAFADYGQNWQVFSRDMDAWQDQKSELINRHFARPGYREAKPLLYTHPLWGVLPWQQD